MGEMKTANEIVTFNKRGLVVKDEQYLDYCRCTLAAQDDEYSRNVIKRKRMYIALGICVGCMLAGVLTAIFMHLPAVSLPLLAPSLVGMFAAIELEKDVDGEIIKRYESETLETKIKRCLTPYESWKRKQPALKAERISQQWPV